ncbi:MAG: Mov34/MPN/PAD-1 family protein [Ignavibacteria bacterium]|nr:Mov34/MPN/PAD-1 family protein [Ignavibacteria bacterium]
MADYLPISGQRVEKEDLALPKARDTAITISSESSPYTQLVECFRIESEDETIVFDTEVERGQKVVHDIRFTERIAVVFWASNNIMPEVWALRKDFPLVPHLNLRLAEFPRSLCLYEEPYEEIKLHWTATDFLERIRRWLALTAKGELHGDDQPLELLLIGTEGTLIVPPDLTTGDEVQLLDITRVPTAEGERLTLVARSLKDDEELDPDHHFVATLIRCKPQPHGIIRWQPQNLSQLHEFLGAGQVDLLEVLRERLRGWSDEKRILGSKLVLVVILPKTRHEGGEEETHEIRAFLTVNPVVEIGVGIGLWEVLDKEVGFLLYQDRTKNGESIRVALLNTVEAFSRENAARLSNLKDKLEPKITQVGLGALGSQVFINLIRMGYGKWTLVDEDYLLPHNLARHALNAFWLGRSKAESLAFIADEMTGDQGRTEWIVANVLHPKGEEGRLEKAYAETDVIVDISTSIPVARYLTRDVDSEAQRISLFLNPSATDLVMLIEDKKRETGLDDLEMQYYRGLVTHSFMHKHLKREEGRVRYAQSCRDVSSTIPQDLVALHAGVASRALRNAIADEKARIVIWHADPDTLQVDCLEVPIGATLSFDIGDWTLHTDHFLIEKIYTARAARLPNETEGVLIGAYDMQRKILYVVDAILSPPDSQEWPTAYIRGCKGLKQEIDRVSDITAYNLQYVGEWHSHPDGCGCLPSRDDMVAFGWLAEIMENDGLPPLMLIAGDKMNFAFYLGKMDKPARTVQ